MCPLELGLLLFAAAAAVVAGQGRGRDETGHGHSGGHGRRRDRVDETVVVVVAEEMALATIEHEANAATMVMAEGVADAATMASTVAGRGHCQGPGRHDAALGREHAGKVGSIISHNSFHLNSPDFVSASLFLGALCHIFSPPCPSPQVLPACLIVVSVSAFPGPDFRASPDPWPLFPSLAFSSCLLHLFCCSAACPNKHMPLCPVMN